MVYIPLFIDVSSLKVLVVGGGMVGSRRARSFLSAGAMVTVVAKEFSEELLKNKAINAIEADIEEGGEIEKLIEQNDLIVIATNNKKINDKVYEMAKSKGKLINNATDASKGNVVFPFRLKVLGNIEVAVTSFGASGIAARRVAGRIKDTIDKDKELEALYESMKEFKKYLKENISDAKLRYKLYFIVENDKEYESYIRMGDKDSALRRAIQIAKKFA